ncbi:MAG: pyruvate kinase [Gammaproteobacteria bacterium]|nr:pyruvate kinase [Gammaproteobacteria bacterium]
MRRTKIVATLGPATDDPELLGELIDAGADVVRLNYSHDTHERHGRRVEVVREQAARRGVEVGIIADLQGPKIRIGGFRDGPVELEDGDDFVIDAELDLRGGDGHHVGVTYKGLPRDVHAGDTLLIDDGRIILKVERVRRSAVHCVVLLGGELSSNKGINREGGGLSAPALTRKDRADLRHAVSVGADYIAVSFPRTAADIVAARKLIDKAGGRCGIIAKIERADALDHAEEILAVSEGIMVARGDLGVEIGDALLVPVQKRLIKIAREMNRIVITATQMMQSMIENQIPTRAEVFDVANAVLDGTDAVMLSAETSVGRYPYKAVEAMARICASTEQQWGLQSPDYQIDEHFERIDQAIAMATMYAANRIGAKAIAALTETGATCMWMSRMNTGIPIFAFTGHVRTQRLVTLYRGVYPIAFDMTRTSPQEVNRDLVRGLLERQAVHEGDTVIISKGDVFGRTGGTNAMKIVRIGDVIA